MLEGEGTWSVFKMCLLQKKQMDSLFVHTIEDLGAFLGDIKENIKSAGSAADPWQG